MTVKELARKAGIAPTTLYSIIQRDAAIRFGTALRISNILNIPINLICKDNPYDDMETLPKLPSDKDCLMVSMEKKAYFSDRTLKIVKNFDYTELPMVDQLIADFYVLDDATRRDMAINMSSSYSSLLLLGMVQYLHKKTLETVTFRHLFIEKNWDYILGNMQHWHIF